MLLSSIVTCGVTPVDEVEAKSCHESHQFWRVLRIGVKLWELLTELRYWKI
jgi:hypothetical protein